MAALIGSVSEYDTATSWSSYQERLGQFFVANDVDDGKKAPILLSAIGCSGYELFKKLCAPDLPSTKTFDELCQIMTDYKHPTPSRIVSRYKFNTRNREEDESIAMYIAELRKLTTHCGFGDALGDLLTDRLVCGVRHEAIQKRLLAEDKLTLEQATKIAVAMEAAESGLKDLAAPRAKSEVYHVQEQNQSGEPAATRQSRPCNRCGGKNHRSSECRFKTATCRYCLKVGHIERVCLAKARGQPRQQEKTVNQVEASTTGVEPHTVFQLSNPHVPAIKVESLVNGVAIPFELDTGSSCTLIPHAVYLKHFGNITLEVSDAVLQTYSGERVTPKGTFTATVAVHGQEVILPILVVPSTGPALLGRDLMAKVQLDWRRIMNVHSLSGSRASEIIKAHPEVFSPGLGELQGVKASINIESGATPRFHKARSLPFAMRAPVEAELDRLLEEGIIEPVQFSEWAAPIVPVVKPDKSIRICGDYKLTINQASKLDRYPIPHIDDLFASLSGGKMFTKLDLSHAYQQVSLDEQSKRFTTISTHRGLYQYTRLPMGCASAPGIFQRVMESVLQGMTHVCVYLDDILITGLDEEEHYRNLQLVLERLREAGLRLKEKKCLFMQETVTYLGHKLSASGIEPVYEKVEAVTRAPAPTNVKELQTFLGLLNYYGRFLPRLSTVLAPLHRLLRKNSTWSWSQKEEAAFDQAKLLLKTAPVLTFYDPAKPLIMSCDASPYGVAAVLSHQMPDGQEQPLGYVSRSLCAPERNYSQLDKEGLALIFGVIKFHKYIYGRQFILATDHKPLHSIFNEKKGISPLTSSRLQRWALTLACYEYEIRHRPGKNNVPADVFSRLPLPETGECSVTPESVNMMEGIEKLRVSGNDIKKWTSKDPTLSRVLKYLLTGWPSAKVTKDDSLYPFASRRDELSILDGCILWGNRLIIPHQGQASILEELHHGHPGVSRMKGLARSLAWWPGMDEDVQEKVRACHTCQVQANMPAPAPLQPWKWPERAWHRLHIDYAGPLQGKMILVVIDAHSKWIEAIPVTSANAVNTVAELRRVFATHGLPAEIVSDNGTPFVNELFQEFTVKNNISHIRVAPYHPASNGMAERAVQTVKQGLAALNEGTLDTRLARFLLTYRRLPQTTTGKAPSELLMGRLLHSRVDKIYPDPSARVHQKQREMKAQHDIHAKARDFAVGEEVYVSMLGKGWVEGEISAKTAALSYVVQLEDGRKIKRHIDHIRKRWDIRQSVPLLDEELGGLASTRQPQVSVDIPETTVSMRDPTDDSPQVLEPESEEQPREDLQKRPRQSSRSRRAPCRYGWE